ncbi:NifB/NifX family molybdenum-iron cluster-binding protein [bacterium]|nr:NifB/NifX family molybdenum-iron cluster-binding protein [bacterium]
MKIALSAATADIHSEIDPRFGRCSYFVIHDTETGEQENVENPGARSSSGAGIETAGFIANLGVDALITGNVGPNAYTTLEAAGIEIFAGVSGSTGEAIEACKQGKLTSTRTATVASHHGVSGAAPSPENDGTLIAVTAESNAGLDAPVGHHFGRCPYYTFVSVRDGRIINATAVENPFFNAHQPGQVPKFIHDRKAHVMIAGGMGGRAVQFFEEFGIEAVTGAFGTVQQTIDAYLGGSLTGTAPCSGGHEHGCQ